jgi:hypothetical protein
VHGTRWDEKGKPYCPTCFKKLILISSQIEGRMDMPTIEAKLEKMERDISNIMRVLGIKSRLSEIETDSPTSNEQKTTSRRRDFPSLVDGAELDSRIESLLNNLDLDTPSVDEIKEKALETMLNNEKESKSEPEVS